jgi:23S rRNA pseudouridine955/2504/2580 synthase
MSGVETRRVAADEAGMRLDRWFRTHYPALGHGALQKLLRKGQVRVDGARARANARLQEGQSVRVPPLPADEARPVRARERLSQDDREFAQGLVIHRDKDIIALNKPAGLAVQGGTRMQRHLDGLLDGLRFDAKERPRLVHRLDKDTSGVLLLGRTRAATTALARIFRTRSARKIYWARVHGAPRPAQGRIAMALKKARTPGGDRVRRADSEDEDALNAVTYYAVIGKAGGRFSWLSVKPVTGRTHQIRAHLAEIGHPIVGDPKYGGQGEQACEGIDKLLHLHARRLTLPHPAGGTFDVTAPLPEHMRRTWTFLGLEEKVDFDPLDEGGAP